MMPYLSYGTRRFGDQPIKPHARPYWEFYASVHGRIAPWLETGKPLPLKSNTLWLFPPGNVHGWKGERGKAARVVVFHFDEVPGEVGQLLQDCDHVSVPMEPKDKDFLYHEAREALPHCRDHDPLEKFYTQRLLMDLALLVLKPKMEAPPLSSLSSPLAKVQAAETWWKNHLTRHPTVSQVACVLGMSEGNLRRLFQQERGCSPQAVKSRVQMEKATTLLASTDTKLDVIADECGFPHASRFCEMFKRAQGMTPTEYRQKKNLHSRVNTVHPSHR